MKKLKLAGVLIALGCAGVTLAITPPTVTQPKPGVLKFTWQAPTTRSNGSALSASEIGGYELYLTNESAVITIPASATSYDYVVPVGYTTKSTDSAQMMTVDTAGARSQPSASVALPVGVTTPKPLPSAPGAPTVAVVPN